MSTHETPSEARTPPRMARALADELYAEQAVSGVTQEQLADVVGVSRRTLGRYLKGERDMPVGVLTALVEALGLDGASLWRRAEERASRPPR